jgi:1,4-dihydroxy-2-naphthoyl-CoA synthase
MADPQFEALHFEVSENIATLTLNRPDRMNAFGGTMSQDLQGALDITDADDSIRAVARAEPSAPGPTSPAAASPANARLMSPPSRNGR